MDKIVKHKILFLPSDNNATSGAFLQMVDLIKCLKNMKCSVLGEYFAVEPFIVLPSKKGTGADLLKKEGLEFIVIPQEDWIISEDISFVKKVKKIIRIFKKDIIAFYLLVKYIKKNKIELVHLNTIWTFIGALAAFFLRKKVVWHIREAIKPAFSYKIIFSIGYKLINCANKIFFISNAVLNTYSKIDISKSVVIYDGIDENKLEQRDRLIFSDKIVYMVCVGAIYKQKGQYNLIDACKLLLQNGIVNWHLTLIGDGEIKKIKEIISHFKMQSFVDVVGPKDNIHEYLSKADIGLCPSHFEGFGRSAAEVCAAGCLLICSEAGAFCEIYKHKETALFCKVDDPYSIFTVIKWALSHKKASKTIAELGRKNILQHFLIRENAKYILNEYSKLLKENRYV